MRKRSKKEICKIFISCQRPSKDGKMQVEMTYEGDAFLIAFLLERAQSILDHSEETSTKISPLSS